MWMFSNCDEVTTHGVIKLLHFYMDLIFGFDSCKPFC